VHQYESLLWKKWEYFLANKSEILKWESSALITNELRLKTLKNAGQYYQEETACHSNGIVAVLQSRKSGDWQDVATAEGWVTVNDSCSQPWTAYRAQKGEILRWRLASPGAWEVFSTTFEERTSSKEQSYLAAELKAKQEAEAKAAAELKAGQEAAAKAVAAKKITINCVKGKLTKKVTAVKPRCPMGYKKK
jgi:hypothetical protein